jgi:hypothetical protein
MAPSSKPIPFSDDLSDPASGFAISEDSDGRVAYVDGVLQINVQPGIEWYSPYQGLVEQDLIISVRARQVAGPRRSEMGVVCRWQDKDNYAAAALRVDGNVSLWRKTGGVEERWQDWTSTAAASTPGAGWYTLLLTCHGPQIRFAVDGIEVATAEDPTPVPGTLALMAGLLEPGELSVAFDDLQVSAP